MVDFTVEHFLLLVGGWQRQFLLSLRMCAGATSFLFSAWLSRVTYVKLDSDLRPPSTRRIVSADLLGARVILINVLPAASSPISSARLVGRKRQIDARSSVLVVAGA